MHKARFYLVTLFPGFARLYRQLGFQFDLFRVGIGHPRICRVNVRQCPRFWGANRRIGMGALMLQFRPRRHCSSWTAPAFPSLLVTKPFTNASSFAPLGSWSEPTGGTVTPVQFRSGQRNRLRRVWSSPQASHTRSQTTAGLLHQGSLLLSQGIFGHS